MEKDDPSDTLEMQVWNLCLNYNMILKNCDYSEFITTKPELAVEHILKRISHSDLTNRMLSTIKLNKDKGFKKNYKKFIKELAHEARFIDRINSMKRFHASVSDSDEDFIKRVQDGKRRNNRKWKVANNGDTKLGVQADSGRRDTNQKRNNKRDNGGRRRDRELPDCLNATCSGKHFIYDCLISTSDENRKLKNEYLEKKRARQEHEPNRNRKGTWKVNGSVGQISNGNMRRNTSLFSGTFCVGAVDVVILADQGVDGNVIPPSALAAIRRAKPDIRVNNLKRAYTFGNGSPAAPPITCKKWIQADCTLRVRRSPGLILRKAKWFVSEEEM